MNGRRVDSCQHTQGELQPQPGGARGGAERRRQRRLGGGDVGGGAVGVTDGLYAALRRLERHGGDAAKQRSGGACGWVEGRKKGGEERETEGGVWIATKYLQNEHKKWQKKIMAKDDGLDVS